MAALVDVRFVVDPGKVIKTVIVVEVVALKEKGQTILRISF